MTTEVLTVPTAFGDLSELSEGLADRVDEERIILYGPSPYDEGELLGFSVLLVDGTPALEGVGRVAAAVDGGDERAPETRFDIVFDSLQLDGRSEVVYERIVLARSSLYGSDPATGEVSIEELEAENRALEGGYAPDAFGTPDESDAVEASAPAEVFASFDESAEGVEEEYAAVDDSVADVAFSEPPAAASVPPAAPSVPPAAPSYPPAAVDAAGFDDAGFDDAGFDDAGFEDSEGSTMVADLEQLRAAAEAPPVAPPPALPSAPPGFVLQAPPGGVLTRPMAAPTWWPEATAPAQPRPSTGWFQYGDTLPIPSAPPRPELDPTLRVSPAPRPGDALQPAAPPSVMPPALVGQHEPSEPPAYMGEDPYEPEAMEAPAPQPPHHEGHDHEGHAAVDANTYDEPESVEAEDWSAEDLDGLDDGLDVEGELDELEGDTRHAVELPDEER